MVTPAARREVVAYLQERHGFSQRRACRAAGAPRATVRYEARRATQEPLRARLRELAAERPRFGYRRLTILVRREQGAVNHKRVYRLYRLEGLAVRRRGRKRVARAARVAPVAAVAPGQRWAMDFMQDSLASGRPFRTLNIVDLASRECLSIEVDTSLPGARVVRVLERLCAVHGRPAAITLDNGPEFAGLALDAWAYREGVRLDFIEPGKPTQNGHLESFNGKFRDECLNQHWFTDLDDARATIATWRDDYNAVRPHSAIGNLTPLAFAERLRQPGMLSA
jgi:putative transposase